MKFPEDSRRGCTSWHLKVKLKSFETDMCKWKRCCHSRNCKRSKSIKLSKMKISNCPVSQNLKLHQKNQRWKFAETPSTKNIDLVCPDLLLVVDVNVYQQRSNVNPRLRKRAQPTRPKPKVPHSHTGQAQWTLRYTLGYKKGGSARTRRNYAVISKNYQTEKPDNNRTVNWNDIT